MSGEERPVADSGSHDASPPPLHAGGTPAAKQRPLPAMLPLNSPPAPLLRPPVPGASRSSSAGAGGSGPRTPRLGLAIPPSPSQKPVGNSTSHIPSDIPQSQRSSSSRPAAPQLRLATPHGSNTTPHESGAISGGSTGSSRPYSSNPLGTSNGETTGRSRTGSVGMTEGRASLPSSASSASHSALSFANGTRTSGINDPSSAISSAYSHDGAGGSDREGPAHILPDLEKLSLERGRPLEVDDLDDDGWLAASKSGRIEEIDTLGEGAGGAVTKCRLKGGRVLFALKVITTDPDPETQKQIRRELVFNQKIAADHICKYYGAFGDSSSGVISIAMEYCEGGSLDSVYKEVKKLGGRIGEKVLGKIAEGVLDGLTYLYGCKIIHRDIKPSNILLCRDGQVKLCDFGVSGEFGTRGDADTFIGTSYYMAPERITGQSYTINSDVWSLGVTILEVAQHRFPFPADGTEMQERAGLIDIIQYIVGQPLPKLKDEPAHGNEPEIKWSDNFKYFIECCLEREPGRRATPWRMLEHPWMVDMKGKKVSMEKFLSKVWDWTA